jgi:hypothetical protein
VTAATLDDAGPLVAGRRVKETRTITPGPKGELANVVIEPIAVATPEGIRARAELANVVIEPIAVATPEGIRARAELEEAVNEGVTARRLGRLDVEVTTWGLDSADERLVAGDSGEDTETTGETVALALTATVTEGIEGPGLSGVAIAGVGAGVSIGVVAGAETGCEELDIELNLPNDDEGEIVRGSKVVLESAWEVSLRGVNGGEEGASLVVVVLKIG